MNFKYRTFVTAFFLLLILTFSSQNRKLDSLKKIISSTRNDSVRLKTLIELSRICSKQGFPNEGLIYGRQALKLSAEKKDLNDQALSCMQMGSNFVALSNTDSATVYYTGALQKYRKLGDTINVSNVYNNLGLINYYKTDYNGALKYYLISLKIKEDRNDSAKLGWNYNAIGALYMEIDNTEKALFYLEKAAALAKARKNFNGYIESSGNIAGIYRDKGQYNKALSIYKEILSTTLKKKDESFLAETYNNIAYVYYFQKKYDLSTMYYKKSLAVSLKQSNQRISAFAYIGLSRNLRATGNAKESIAKAYDALALSQKLKIEDVTQTAYLELYRNYKQINSDSALYYYEKNIAAHMSVLDEGKKVEMVKMEERFENEKKMAINNINHAKEIELEKEKNKNQRTVSYFFILIVVLITALLFVIYNRLRITRKQKEIINIQKLETEEQKAVIEEKQKEIVDSINYAKRIQYTLLAQDTILRPELNDHFILFKPKDIVSGDFYWATKKDGRFYLAVCDCTGHGVPGAFMSLLNISFLNEAITEKNIPEPNKIFDHVRKRLIENISQDGAQDGMDGILICIDTKTNKLTYSAANNAPVLISANTIIELPKDKMPVGKGEWDKNFTLHEIEVKNGDALYLYTDGFADQFGGPKGKKFKYKQLNTFLSDHAALSMVGQSKALLNEFETWKGELEQVDDVCIIGIRL